MRQGDDEQAKGLLRQGHVGIVAVHVDKVQRGADELRETGDGNAGKRPRRGQQQPHYLYECSMFDFAGRMRFVGEASGTSSVIRQRLRYRLRGRHFGFMGKHR